MSEPKGWVAMQRGTTDLNEIHDELMRLSVDDFQSFLRSAGFADESDAIIEAVEGFAEALSVIRSKAKAFVSERHDDTGAHMMSHPACHPTIAIIRAAQKREE